MDGGAWQATVHRVAKSQTRLKQVSMYIHPHLKKMERIIQFASWSYYRDCVNLAVLGFFLPGVVCMLIYVSVYWKLSILFQEICSMLKALIKEEIFII